MPYRIKNWNKFQHFKDRRPPWVKLYRDLLDDREWHQLEPHAAKVLVMLWLIASENDGNLPDVADLAFRLRQPEQDILDAISKLSHWLEQVDIGAISERHQSDAPETEEEKRREETEARARAFETFWTAYPKKRAPAEAEKAFAAVTEPLDKLLSAILAQSKSEDWQRENGRYIPNPATWLEGRQWENVVTVELSAGSRGPDPALEKLKADAAVVKTMPADIRAKAAAILGKPVPHETGGAHVA